MEFWAQCVAATDAARINAAGRYEAFVPAAARADIAGRDRWYAVARIRMVTGQRQPELIRLPGEWHGQTAAEAEARARRAAEDWIAAR